MPLQQNTAKTRKKNCINGEIKYNAFWLHFIIPCILCRYVHSYLLSGKKTNACPSTSNETENGASDTTGNLPLSMVEPIIDLIKSIAGEFGAVIDLKCGSTKAAETVNSILAEKCLDIYSDIFKKNKFSLIIDETTDICKYI